MNDKDGMFPERDLLSDQEIIARFKNVFGREITPAERRAFFLQDSTLEKEPN